ncbi:uracil-DNA glycosylase [Pelagibacterium montanilacus]|uniref:uracil-DNA glycosylase n=1 Tax=Pelagibacterium montanilacus TaxID=2185280 RepID=UPI000F8E17E2|nr:uracil-DNA glycosylase [Pelagibacterium montanilacus]
MVAKELDIFLECLLSYTPLDSFNPWREICEQSDSADSHTIRLNNLTRVLEACLTDGEVDIWMGRDLGWRGGRRTGVPLVDELTLSSYGRSLRASPLQKATVDRPMKERTATEIELARRSVGAKVFFWNVFPYHPHEQGSPLSNRMHTRQEKELGREIFDLLVAFLPVRRFIAIGNDAANALDNWGFDVLSVRHPSYGGQRDFHRQVEGHYGIAPSEPQLALL